MIEVLMPRLSDSMEEGVILNWLIEEGDEVSRGDELVEIETDKANMTFEADDSGLVHIVAQEGDSLPVGAPIAQLLAPGEEPSGESGAEQGVASDAQDHGEGEADSPPAARPVVASSDAEGDEHPEQTERVKASPLARRMASEQGVDLASLEGSGPGGRVVKIDVERAAEESEKQPKGRSSSVATGGKGDVEVLDTSRLQKTVARRMSEAKATIPHFYVSTEVDMGECVAARARLKERAAEGQVVPSFNDMVVKASALALKEFPKANGAWKDESIELYSRINIGIAVAAEDALVVPVISDVDQLGLVGISAEARRLAAAVRDGSITPPDLSGGTFTVSNLGMFGATDFEAIVNPGQAAILAVGSIEDRPVVREGELVAGKVMKLTLSCDHRILYGADGGQFLARIKDILEEPMSLAL